MAAAAPTCARCGAPSSYHFQGDDLCPEHYAAAAGLPVSSVSFQGSAAQNGSSTNVLGALVSLGIGGWVIWFFMFGGLEKQTAEGLDSIYKQVAADAVTQYNMTRQSGTSIDICVHAGLVSAAYLQAMDDTHYQQWKRTEAADCAAAGMPQ